LFAALNPGPQGFALGLHGLTGGLDHASHVRQHLGIDGIGLGDLAQGLGEGTGSARIDPGDGKPGFAQHAHQRALVAAGGFQQQVVHAVPLQVRQQLGMAGRGVGQGQMQLVGEHADGQGGFGYVDTNKGQGHKVLVHWGQERAASILPTLVKFELELVQLFGLGTRSMCGGPGSYTCLATLRSIGLPHIALHPNSRPSRRHKRTAGAR